MKPPPQSLAWTSTWQMFVAYAFVFLTAGMFPLWPPLRGAVLALGAFSAFMAGTMRMLNITRPLWDTADRCPRCNRTSIECVTFEDVGFGSQCCEDCTHGFDHAGQDENDLSVPLRRLREMGEEAAERATPSDFSVRRALQRVLDEGGEEGVRRYLQALDEDDAGHQDEDSTDGGACVSPSVDHRGVGSVEPSGAPSADAGHQDEDLPAGRFVRCTTAGHEDEPAAGTALTDEPDENRYPYCSACLRTLGADYDPDRWGDPDPTVNGGMEPTWLERAGVDEEDET